MTDGPKAHDAEPPEPPEPKAPDAAWTEERGTSDEGRERSEGGMGRWVGRRRRAGQHSMTWLAGRQNRVVGAAAGSTLALALLVCGCVFAAIAGPALSLHTRSQALHQTLAKLTPTAESLQVSGNWADFAGPLAENGAGGVANLTPGQLVAATHEMAHGFAALPLPLGPGQWAGLTTNLYDAFGVGPRAQAGGKPKLEVVYRDLLTSNARVVAGSYASAAAPAGTLAVAVTTQTAARFGLHPGSKLSVTLVSGPVRLFVTAILTERAAGSTFWTQDAIAGTPALNVPPPDGLPYWVGGVFADPGQLGPMQNAFSQPGMTLTWEFPLNLSGVNATQAQGVENALNRAVTATPTLTGALAPGAGALTVTSPLISNLATFLATQTATQTVLLLLFVSLIAVGATVILLAARMIVARRDGELRMLRARGGSLRQVAALMTRAAVTAAVPAAVIGAGLAVAVIPGGTAFSLTGWLLAGVTLLAALAGPPLIAVGQHRRPVPASNPARNTSAETGRRKRAWRRPVAEVTACAAAVAGLVVLRDQGLPTGGGIDLYLTITPLLVAIPVVVVMLRLYPLVIRGLLAACARGAGATGFVALSQAARSALTGVLPAFGLVLALSLATFAGMVNDGINRGEVAASWQTTGADVLIDTGPSSPPAGPAAVKAIAAVRGVQHATAVWTTNWVTPGGQPVTVVAVDPASYTAVVAGTPFPAFPAARIGAAGGTVAFGGAAVPVLASTSAAAMLGPAPTQLTSLYPMGPVKVRVAGTLTGTPAQPGGGAFVVMPLETLPGPSGAPVPNMILVTGSSIDDRQLTAVASKVIPGNLTTFRTAVLASLASSPLQHGAVLIVALTIATAAAFGLFIVILGLALGSAERELTQARLTVMGHERPVELALAETMPAVLAAIIAGAVCAVALPHLVGSSVDLSAFTGTGAAVELSPDVLALGLPAVAILVLALVTLLAQTRTLRRRGVTGPLRAY
jgi:putative ABC transport system permease protein